ncbi:MAG: hypothetical protein ABGY75_08740, partial [Gemmataceae bacterium]
MSSADELSSTPDAGEPGRVPVWLLPHVFSLDAPVVAAVWQRFLGAAFGLSVPPAATVALVSVVWCIYLLDRLWDTRGPAHPHTDRHRFAAAHPSLLTAFAAVAFVAGLGSVAFLTGRTIVIGLGVALAVGVYLIAVHGLKSRAGSRGWKELLVGVVFAAGVAVPLLAGVGAFDWLPAVGSFGMACWWNCRLIDRWEEGRPTGRTVGRVIGLGAAVLAAFAPLPVRVA